MPKLFPLIRKIIGGGGGPNPTDAFGLKLTFPDVVPAETDAASFAFKFPEVNAALTDAATLGIAFADLTPAQQDLLLSLGITFTEASPAQTDAASYLIKANYDDPNVAPTDSATLNIKGLGDTNATPTEGAVAFIRCWASGCVTNDSSPGQTVAPANANGQNDGTFAKVTTGTGTPDTTNPVTVTTGSLNVPALVPRIFDSVSVNNGTMVGGFTAGASGATGDGDNALTLDGSTGYVNLGTPANLLALVNAWTLEAWVYATALPIGSGVIANSYVGDVQWELGFDSDQPTGTTTARPFVGFYSGGAWSTARASADVTLNAWHHLVGTWDGTTLKVYLDKVLVGSSVPGRNPVAGNGSSIFMLGRRHDLFSAVQNYFPGKLDECAIYGSALTATRVAAHFDAAGNPAGSTSYYNTVLADSPTSYWRMNRVFGQILSAKLRLFFHTTATLAAVVDSPGVDIKATASGGYTGNVWTGPALAVLYPGENHDVGDYTFDVSSLTLAQLQSLQLVARYSAAVVALPQYAIFVDAWCVELQVQLA